MRAAFLTLTLAASRVHGEAPVAKVLSMMSELQASIIKEGEVSQKEYAELSEWCEDRASNLGHEIKTGQRDVASLKAAISEEDATLQTLSAKIEKLTGSIASDDADMAAATTVRKSEASDFAAEEAELMETIDTLRRATSILEREMSKGGASMLQWTDGSSIAQALSAMVHASLISTTDASKLTALLQNSRRAADEADEPGAPAGAVYESHSSDIVDTLESLTEKAEAQLDALRKKETASLHNYEMLKQSLEDETRFAQADLDDSKKGIAASGERKATAEGDLTATTKDLAKDVTTKGNLHQICMMKAQIFQAEVKSRAEELKAIATAKSVLEEATGAALLQPSFLQQSSSNSASLAGSKLLHFVRDLARKQQSDALMQFASRLATAMHTKDPFAKVKGLITDMISKLESAASADAAEKAYCDKELSETAAKKEDKTAETEKITTRIDRLEARSAELKEETASLQNAMSNLASSQAEMDKIRQEEKDTYSESKAELDKAIAGVKMAIKVLSDYYASDGKAHDAAEGAGGGIISLLEVVEADFSKNLAEINADEEGAAAQFESITKDNEIERTAKDQDVKYKIKEAKYLDKTSAELSADRTGVQAELDAVLEYLSKLQDRCIAKAEKYADRQARYAAEIEGLKQALTILESETALVQRRSIRRTLRGTQ